LKPSRSKRSKTWEPGGSRRAQPLVEVGEQPSAVAEVGQLVRDGLKPAALQDPQVVPERETGAEDHPDERRERERHREVVDRMDVVPREQPGCHEPAGRRN
jgi:hypothetical protein